MDEPVGYRIRDWLAEREIRHQDFADRCKIDRALLSRYLNGHRRPSPKHRHAIERETQGAFPPASWDEPLASERSDAPPASEDRPLVDSDEPLGDTAEELRASADRLKKRARNPSLTAQQQTQAERACSIALGSLLRLEKGGAIHEHPDARGFLEDHLRAVTEVVGPEMALRIAERVAEFQSAREPRQRKAAA